MEAHQKEKHVSGNIGGFIERLRSKLAEEKVSDDKKVEMAARIDVIESAAMELISDEGREYINNLSFEEAENMLMRHFRGILIDPQSIAKYEKLSKEGVQNIVSYLRVRGYENKDLAQRKEKEPIPTAEEVLMGCYIEQIENHVRDAVRALRAKGYNTVESGFESPYEKGGQFFHIIADEKLEFPEDLIKEIEKEYGAAITVEQKELDLCIRFKSTDQSIKQLSEWGRCLGAFAARVPAIGEAGFARNGATVDFAEEVIRTVPKEAILKTATTEKQRELIERLYSCKTEGEIEELIGIEEEDRRMHWNAGKMEKG